MARCKAVKIFRRNFIRLFKRKKLILLILFLILLYIVMLIKELYEIEMPQIQLGKRNNFSNNVPLQNLTKPTSMSKTREGSSSYGNMFRPQRIDWHNLTQIIQDSLREGPGEQGKPFIYSPLSPEASTENFYAAFGFNGAISDIIPLNRSLPDIRHKACRKKLYLSSLPTVSVVVPFHNEHWSTLLRTAHSALHRAPHQLVKEIFLVDDASTKELLSKQLDDYVAANMTKVTVIHLPERSGLIKARLEGAKMAIGDVIVFLDSATEANVNWLPPLLEPIALDYRTVVCPIMDQIAHDTFEYRAQDGARGVFDWELNYKQLPLLPKDLANMPDPYETPIMAGKAFAISRDWFRELGGYDPGFDGLADGEIYELSFKVWQCGGRILDAPCSRMGRINRKFEPFYHPEGVIAKNHRRVAEVWMDEYAQYLYNRRPHYKTVATGDLTSPKLIRSWHKCKPFKWFMARIAFDVPSIYPMVEPGPFAWGRLMAHRGNFCIDATGAGERTRLKISPCGDSAEFQWSFTWRLEVRLKDRNVCWDLPEYSVYKPVFLHWCHTGGGNQKWTYNLKTLQITHSSGCCLDWESSEMLLFVSKCRPRGSGTADNYPHSQMWKWQHVNWTAFANYMNPSRVIYPQPYDEDTPD